MPVLCARRAGGRAPDRIPAGLCRSAVPAPGAAPASSCGPGPAPRSNSGLQRPNLLPPHPGPVLAAVSARGLSAPGGAAGLGEATVGKAFFLSFFLTLWRKKNCGLFVFLGHPVFVTLRAGAPLRCTEEADLPLLTGPVGPLVLAEPWSEGFDALILANVTESYEGA